MKKTNTEHRKKPYPKVDGITRDHKGKIIVINLPLTDKDEPLKPCPFCGSRDLELRNTHTAKYWIECQDCGAECGGDYDERSTSTAAHRKTKKSAIKAWNSRV